jgi:hypothetical protein
MLELIKNFFQARERVAKSFEDFARLAKKMKCTSVVIRTNKSRVGRFFTDRYSLEFTAATSRGPRFVLFTEQRFEREWPEFPQTSWVELYMTGDFRMRQLQDKLPGVSVNLIDTNNQPINDDRITNVYKMAEKLGLTFSHMSV